MVQDSKTRGNCLKIDKQQARTNLKHNTFTLRVVNACNSLPDYVVTAPSMNSFKNGRDSIRMARPFKTFFLSSYHIFLTTYRARYVVKLRLDQGMSLNCIPPRAGRELCPDLGVSIWQIFFGFSVPLITESVCVYY